MRVKTIGAGATAMMVMILVWSGIAAAATYTFKGSENFRCNVLTEPTLTALNTITLDTSNGTVTSPICDTDQSNCSYTLSHDGLQGRLTTKYLASNGGESAYVDIAFATTTNAAHNMFLAVTMNAVEYNSLGTIDRSCENFKKMYKIR